MREKHRQTILVVDDIPENVDILLKILQKDYALKIATNGRRALEIASSYPLPDLILLDIMMPGMDGYEVCHHLKQNPKTCRIPVIFVTAKGAALDEAQGFEVGGVDYVTKPIQPLTLMARVQTQLALYDQNRTLEVKVQQRTVELFESRLDIIRRLGLAAEYKDNETGMHIMRMSHMCHRLALALGMTPEDADTLLQVSPMHDVGKIGIPDRILLKPGKLTPEEWEIMKSHTTIGARILGEQASGLLHHARIIALTHHEKWDGSGYPLGLKGNDIPIFGRIAAITDVFDALTSERPYKKAWPIEQALEEISRSRGTHFDPKVVDAFFTIQPQILHIKEQFCHEHPSLLTTFYSPDTIGTPIA